MSKFCVKSIINFYIYRTSLPFSFFIYPYYCPHPFLPMALLTFVDL